MDVTLAPLAALPSPQQVPATAGAVNSPSTTPPQNNQKDAAEAARFSPVPEETTRSEDTAKPEAAQSRALVPVAETKGIVEASLTGITQKDSIDATDRAAAIRAEQGYAQAAAIVSLSRPETANAHTQIV